MNEERLATALRRAYAAPPPDEALTARVEALTMPEPARPAPKLARRRVLAFGLAAAVLTAAALLNPLGPPVAPKANALERVQRAVWNVPRAHAVNWLVTPDGQVVKSSEEWFADGLRRQVWYRDGDPTREIAYGGAGYWKSEAGMVRVDIGDRVDAEDQTWTYRPQEQTAYVGGDWDTPAPLSVALMQQSYARLGIEGRIHDLGTATQKDGRQVQTVRVDLPDDEQSYYERRPPVPGRSVRPSEAYLLLFVDTATGLPFRQELWQDDLEGAGFTRRSVTDLDYDTPVSPALFAHDAPPGTQVVEEERDGPRQFMADFTKHAVRRTVGGRTVTLYPLLVNETGQAVVSYTVSGGPADGTRDWQVSLHDPDNRPWTLLDGGPVGRRFPALRARYTFGGLPLQVDWLEPDPEWTENMLTHMDVIFRLPGGEVTIPSGVGLVSGPMLRAEPYQELMAINADTVYGRTRNRALYFQDGRWKTDGPVRQFVERDGYDPLRGAIGWYKMAMEVDDECALLNGTARPSHSRDLREMAGVLERLGRDREAREARALADREDGSGR